MKSYFWLLFRLSAFPILLLFFVACAPATSNEAVGIVRTETPNLSVSVSSTPLLPSPTTEITPTFSPTITIQPSPTLIVLPAYSNIPPLVQLVITKKDMCLANYDLPIYTQYHDFIETDLTSSTDQKYCEVDCIRRRWSAYDGANFTFTVVRVGSLPDATSLLAEELNRIQQLYSDREKYIGVGFDNPYTGEGDSSWAGKPYPGLTGYAVVARSSLMIIMEWTQVPQGLDLEFDFGMTDEFAQIQFEKIDNALGTPFPPSINQSRCTS